MIKSEILLCQSGAEINKLACTNKGIKGTNYVLFSLIAEHCPTNSRCRYYLLLLHIVRNTLRIVRIQNQTHDTNLTF